MEHAEGKTHVYEAFPFLFTEFEIESDNLNGKVHYTTKDGKYAIAYNTCRQWVVSILDKHGRYTVINTGPRLFDDVIFLCFRGNCAGKIYTDDDHTCPNEISHTWKYKNNYWTAANEGVKIVCIPGPAMMRAKKMKNRIFQMNSSHLGTTPAIPSYSTHVADAASTMTTTPAPTTASTSGAMGAFASAVKLLVC